MIENLGAVLSSLRPTRIPGKPLWQNFHHRWIDECIYLDRSRTKCCKHLGFEAQFCERVGIAHAEISLPLASPIGARHSAER